MYTLRPLGSELTTVILFVYTRPTPSGAVYLARFASRVHGAFYVIYIYIYNSPAYIVGWCMSWTGAASLEPGLVVYAYMFINIFNLLIRDLQLIVHVYLRTGMPSKLKNTSTVYTPVPVRTYV